MRELIERGSIIINGVEMNKIAITIFGGTGDLTYRKLVPAAYNLFHRNLLGEDFKVIIIGRRDYTHEAYIETADKWLRQFARLRFNEETLAKFYEHLVYYKMDFTNLEEYKGLDEFYSRLNYKNNLIYYAVAPQFFNIISEGVSTCKSVYNPKIILEKPFGTDLESAKLLSETLDRTFGKDNISRIDHYLGKEMLRNIISLRETNPIIANAWSKDNIDSVQISALEMVGVETRGPYYDKAGALKDMVQNHLLQILSIVALDNTHGIISEEQSKVLRQLRDIDKIDIKKSVVLAQYEGYRDEDKVSKNSKTETYACLKLFIDNDRWQDVPFFIRTGKKCSDREVEVVINFKRIAENVDPNVLIIKVQPTEGVYLEFNIKTPGEQKGLSKAKIEFCQNCNDIFRQNTPEAYERMILACIEGDNSWFSKWDQIETSWKYIQDLKDLYEKENLPIYSYAQGSKGPKEMNDLAENIDQYWR